MSSDATTLRPVQCDAIIFDCDGVLVDSERLANEVLVECIRPLGIALSVEDAMARFCGTLTSWLIANGIPTRCG